MSLEAKQPQTLLIVDDEPGMLKLLARLASRAGVPKEDIESFDGPDSAVARIEELDGTIAGIVSDGLNGGWKTVIAAAREANIPAIVYTSSTEIQQEAEADGVPSFAKLPTDPDPMQAILASLQSQSGEAFIQSPSH